jgi:hypothetical protein
MEFYEVRFAFRVDEAVTVHAEAFHQGKECGMARSLIIHIYSAPASRNESGQGNLIASWMKKTGMLLPIRSQLPSGV